MVFSSVMNAGQGVEGIQVGRLPADRDQEGVDQARMAAFIPAILVDILWQAGSIPRKASLKSSL